MPQSIDVLLNLFAQKTVVDLPTIREALGGVSTMTAFRHLRRVPYCLTLRSHLSKSPINPD